MFSNSPSVRPKRFKGIPFGHRGREALLRLRGVLVLGPRSLPFRGEAGAFCVDPSIVSTAASDFDDHNFSMAIQRPRAVLSIDFRVLLKNQTSRSKQTPQAADQIDCKDPSDLR